MRESKLQIPVLRVFLNKIRTVVTNTVVVGKDYGQNTKDNLLESAW